MFGKRQFNVTSTTAFFPSQNSPMRNLWIGVFTLFVVWLVCLALSPLILRIHNLFYAKSKGKKVEMTRRIDTTERADDPSRSTPNRLATLIFQRKKTSDISTNTVRDDLEAGGEASKIDQSESFKRDQFPGTGAIEDIDDRKPGKSAVEEPPAMLFSGKKSGSPSPSKIPVVTRTTSNDRRLNFPSPPESRKVSSDESQKQEIEPVRKDPAPILPQFDPYEQQQLQQEHEQEESESKFAKKLESLTNVCRDCFIIFFSIVLVQFFSGVIDGNLWRAEYVMSWIIFGLCGVWIMNHVFGRVYPKNEYVGVHESVVVTILCLLAIIVFGLTFR